MDVTLIPAKVKCIGRYVIGFGVEYRFGNITNGGNRHFSFLYLAWGVADRQAFSIVIIGLTITITWQKRK